MRLRGATRSGGKKQAIGGVGAGQTLRLNEAGARRRPENGDDVLVLATPVLRIGSEAPAEVLCFRVGRSILAGPSAASGHTVLVFDRRGALAYSSASAEETPALEPIGQRLRRAAPGSAVVDGDFLGAASVPGPAQPWQAIVLEPTEDLLREFPLISLSPRLATSLVNPDSAAAVFGMDSREFGKTHWREYGRYYDAFNRHVHGRLYGHQLLGHANAMHEDDVRPDLAELEGGEWVHLWQIAVDAPGYSLALTVPDSEGQPFLFSPRLPQIQPEAHSGGGSRAYLGLSFDIGEPTGLYGSLAVGGSVASLRAPGMEDGGPRSLYAPLLLHGGVELGYRLDQQNTFALSIDRATSPDPLDHGSAIGNFRLHYGLKF